MNTKSMKSLLPLAVLAAALAPSAAFAAVHVTPATHAFFGAKMIHFSVRNQSGASIDLRAGDQTLTVPAGKTIEVKVAPGTRLVTATKTDKRDVGEVICEASAALADTTVVLN